MACSSKGPQPWPGRDSYRTSASSADAALPPKAGTLGRENETRGEPVREDDDRLRFGGTANGYMWSMGLILILLLVALIFAGVGFAVHLFWIVAIVFFIAWLVGLLVGSGRRSAA